MKLTPAESKFLSKYLARKVAAGMASSVLRICRGFANAGFNEGILKYASRQQIDKEYDAIVKRLHRASQIHTKPPAKRRSS